MNSIAVAPIALLFASAAAAHSSESGQEALRELADRYSGIEAYASRTRCHFLNGTAGEIAAENDAEFVFRFRGGRFDLEGFLPVNFYGETDRFVLHSRHVNRYRTYDRSAVESWRDAIFFPAMFLDAVYPVSGLLLDEPGRAPTVANLDKISVADDGMTLILGMRLEGNPNQSEYRLTWRLDPATGLIASYGFDFRPGRNPATGPGLMAGQCEITDLDAADEAHHPRGFTPDANDRLVQPGEFPDDLKLDPTDDGSFRALEGRPAPEFTAVTLAGDTVSLADLRGKVIVLDFWATWCPNCALSWRYMHEVEKAFEDAEDVAFFGVNLDADDRDLVQRYLTRFDIQTPQLLDPDGDMSGDYRAMGTPAFVVIGPDGHVAATLAGQNPSLAQRLIDAINEARSSSGENK